MRDGSVGPSLFYVFVRHERTLTGANPELGSSTYGLPLSVTFVRPGLNSCVLHSTCRWLQLPLVGDYSPLLYRLTLHPASVRLPDAQSAITLPRTVATLPRLGYGSTCFRADLQVFSSGILNMPSLRPAVTSPLLPGIPVMWALCL